MTKLTILSSQGSAVTHLRCGGQCNKNFVVNLLPNSTVKKFENRLIFARVMDRRTEVPFFDSQCICNDGLSWTHRSFWSVFKASIWWWTVCVSGLSWWILRELVAWRRKQILVRYADNWVGTAHRFVSKTIKWAASYTQILILSAVIRLFRFTYYSSSSVGQIGYILECVRPSVRPSVSNGGFYHRMKDR